MVRLICRACLQVFMRHKTQSYCSHSCYVRVNSGTPESRIPSKFDIDIKSGCWNWTGCMDRYGYGKFSVDGRPVGAHRAAFNIYVGDIGSGMTLDHLCRNTRCVNPDHLEPVTIGENVLRGTGFAATKKRQTHCVRGHEFTSANTFLTAGGQRQCRECGRARGRERTARKTCRA